MKSIICALTCACAASAAFGANVEIPKSAAEDTESVMTKAYWDIWNPEVMKKIDADIEANRKADAVVKIEGVPAGTEVSVNQVSHDFIFGTHIFNFDQLGDPILNAKYKAQFGNMFNSATVAFYWGKFELEHGRPRFVPEYWDMQEFWEKSESPKSEIHWRRPAPDKIIEFCKENGIRVHGHTLVWGNRQWHFPAWLLKACAKGEEAKILDTLISEYGVDGGKATSEKYTQKYKDMSAEELAKLLPNTAAELKRIHQERIRQIAEYYGDTVDSWDIVNESATDFGRGFVVKDAQITKSWYGMMPGDYPYLAFETSQEVFPANVKLNINDYKIDGDYAKEVKSLLERGCKVDIVGAQMHLFKPQETIAISEGKEIQTPEKVYAALNSIDVGLPIHLSEITVTAPDTTDKGRMMQAIITRNLYKLWFSIKPMMGITWWNTVDDCGAPGEPAMSGIFTRTMTPKPAFYALNELINGEWRTNLTEKVDDKGEIKFRAFRGKYMLTWKDAEGKEHFKYVDVK